MTRCTALMAREYKLLLKAKRFKGVTSLESANRFWDDQVKPIIKRCRDETGTKWPRHKNDFEPAQRRMIRFLDTGRHLLTESDYILRERSGIDEHGNRTSDRELTLKLRTSDLFVAAGTTLPGSQTGFDTELEEDIAPLQVSVKKPSGKCTIAVADPRSIRSRFSVSTKQSVPDRIVLDRLGDVLGLYPTLRDELALTSPDEIRSDDELCSGPRIRELVFKEAEVDLGDGVAAKFTLTLWYFEPEVTVPRVAEISFKCKVKDGHLPRGAAWRALRLFVGMQDDLGRDGWVNFAEQSKTALALPPKEPGRGRPAPRLQATASARAAGGR